MRATAGGRWSTPTTPTCRATSRSASGVRTRWPASPGARVIPELAPREGDVVLPKRFYSAFHETGLDPLLRQSEVDTIILCGQHTHICVRHTSADAFYRGYRIVVPPDAVDSFTEEDHEAGLAYLQAIYGAEPTPVAEIVAPVSAGRDVR